MADRTRKRRPYAARVPMAERRQQLLDAALRLIDRDGYDGVSIDAIAREAGVTRPVVYGAFDGLGPLMLALLDRQQERARTQLFATLPAELGSSGLPDLIAQTVPALHRMVLADPVTWRAILRAPHNVPDVVLERIEHDREAVRTVIEHLVVEGLADHGGRVDAEVISHAVMAVLDHFGRLVLADPETFDAARLTAAVRAALGAASGQRSRGRITSG